MSDLSPLDRTALALLPVLIDADNELRKLGSARSAARLSTRIGAVLELIVDTGEDVAMYYARWAGMDADILARLDAALAEWRSMDHAE
jgi:hypothetical protein